MDRNTIIGISLIFILFYLWARVNAPTEEQLAEMDRKRDSIALVQETPDFEAQHDISSAVLDTPTEEVSDSLVAAGIAADFGPYAPAAIGSEKIESLENDLLKLDISNKGGRIVKAQLKQYQKLGEDEEHKSVYSELLLLEDDDNKFEYYFPQTGVPGGRVKSSDLYFEPIHKGNELILKASLANGRSFEQIYKLNNGSYKVDYSIRLTGFDRLLSQDFIELHWLNHLDRLHLNTQYEQMYSTVYFKPSDDDTDYCSCRGDDTEVVDEQPLEWVSHSNQFFNSSLMSTDRPFRRGVMETRSETEESPNLKTLATTLAIPFQGGSREEYNMEWYIGPNQFDVLRSFDRDLEEIIPFGRSIFGSINRWIIRPIFNFLSRFFTSKGIVILLLTIIVKALVFPLTYKMIRSQSKMAALKPQMAKAREKYKDDQQKMQMENMKLYREYGVNPVGGCFPMILQMPIWFALYRFFPASIEFRQASFLWANDLSSYDVFFRLPFQIPFVGGHISLFTILWAATLIIYTYYNSKLMDMSAMSNPMMKYMQYAMPLMFVVFFNSYASGLTCYLLFSNILNITQTLVTKNYLIDHKKLEAELDANKKKPKKKGGFQQRLEQALQEQQRQAAEREKTSKRKR